MLKNLTFAILFFLSQLNSLSYAADATQPISLKELFLYGEPRPTIIVAHGCDGISNQAYRDWAKELKSWGYNAILSDSFQIRKYVNLCASDKSAIQVMPSVRRDDLVEIAKYVKSQPWHSGKVGAIGFSHGGSTMLSIAASRQKEISAVVAYYPGCNRWFVHSSLTPVITEPEIPLQVHLAEKDDWTPISECNYLIGAEEFIYKNVTHGFDMDYPPRNYYGHYLRYDKEAHLLSKKRSKEFFDKNLN